MAVFLTLAVPIASAQFPIFIQPTSRLAVMTRHSGRLLLLVRFCRCLLRLLSLWSLLPRRLLLRLRLLLVLRPRLLLLLLLRLRLRLRLRNPSSALRKRKTESREGCPFRGSGPPKTPAEKPGC